MKSIANKVKESGNDKYDDGDGYWSGDNEWCNRYMYYANSVANRAQVEELCEKHSTDKCTFYVLEDDAEEDPVSEIGYTLAKGVEEALTEATIYITKAEMAKLDKEVEEARKEVAKYNIEDIYYELTDIYTVQTEIKILDVDQNEYRLEMFDGELFFSPKE